MFATPWMAPPRFWFPDAQALSRNYAPGKLAIGQSVTRGLGAGGVPSVGRKAAEESMDDLSEFAVIFFFCVSEVAAICFIQD